MSSVGSETTIADEWLTTVLVDVPQSTGVFEGLAPVDQPYPFVVFQMIDAPDLYGVGPKARIWTDAEYIVKATAEASFAALRPFAAAIDLRLDGVQAELAEGLVLGVRRTAQYRSVEQHEGRIIRHLGGRYRVLVQAT